MDLSDNAAHIPLSTMTSALVINSPNICSRTVSASPLPTTPLAPAHQCAAYLDLVLLDVMMPGESGLDLARDLKTISNVPICMLTARAEAEHRVEGLEIGVDDFVPKPFEPRELVLRLRNILRRGRSRQAPVTKSRWATTFSMSTEASLSAGKRASS